MVKETVNEFREEVKNPYEDIYDTESEPDD